MNERKWKDLQPGDHIVCPGDGRPERVTRSEKGSPGHWFVRTDRHDHIRPKEWTVAIAEAEQ